LGRLSIFDALASSIQRVEIASVHILGDVHATRFLDIGVDLGYTHNIAIIIDL
jgi:hypothetical protein